MKISWKSLWNLNVPSKIKHFCRRALNDTLPTNINLLKRGMDLSLSCFLYKDHPEYTDHVLITCPRALVWNNISPAFLNNHNFNNSFKDRWLSTSTSRKREELDLFTITCWALWNDRNKSRLDQQIPNPIIRSSWILKYYEDFKNAISRKKEIYLDRAPNPRVKQKVWSLPPEGFIKVNVDAA